IVRGTKRSEFSYGGHGRIVRIVEKDGAAVLSDNRYLWCNGTLCEERDSTGGTVVRRFFAQGEQLVSSGTVSLYTRDHLQSVREITTTAGAVSQQISYDPWGRLTASPATPAPAFGFTGLKFHGPTGLLSAVWRFCDPAAGRWLSRNPLGEADGQNLYAYTQNSPARYTDRAGISCPGAVDILWKGPAPAQGGWNPETGPVTVPDVPGNLPSVDGNAFDPRAPWLGNPVRAPGPALFSALMPAGDN
ncbi:MAG TPA: RHS repeat-associated core domain-containing protein, partial [Verrucomicrobiales bacterium]|nr:RHS repeat-associated core domain-containing protein [Verrucomicrobiales bacterium]